MNDSSDTWPTFLIIGEQKAGTGWLRDRLLEHDDVFICGTEINFFNRRTLFEKGIEWYLARFRAAKGRAAIGEKSPEYFWLNSGRDDYVQDIDRQIDEYLGGIQLILSLRNPIDRALSAYLHHLRHRGRRIDPGSLGKFDTLELLMGAADDLSRFGVIERGFYASRLKAFMDRFGPRMLVLIFEDDIVENPESGLRRVCNHIGVGYGAADFSLWANDKASKPSLGAIKAGYRFPALRPVIRALDPGPPYKLILSPDQRASLAALYAEDVAETRSLLNRDIWIRDWAV